MVKREPRRGKLRLVDGLKTSEYLNETAAKHIEGDITIEQVKELIDTYYQSKTARTPEDDEKEEADKAAANITKIINEPSFTFSLHGLTSIHKRIFMNEPEFHILPTLLRFSMNL